MSGGKGGSETTETTIPAWIRDPAIRNLARAEAVQRIPYMPYYGADVAAFTPTQNAAFEQNIGAAEAFGLLAPNTLTATSGMPTPTDWDGFTGYSSQPMYESALAELKSNMPDAVAQYDALFGGNVPTTWGNNPRFRGSAGGGGGNPPSSPPRNIPLNMPQANIDAMVGQLDRIDAERTGGDAEAQRQWNEIKARGGYDSYNKLQQRDDIYGTYTAPPVSPPPRVISTAGQGLPWDINNTGKY